MKFVLNVTRDLLENILGARPHWSFKPFYDNNNALGLFR